MNASHIGGDGAVRVSANCERAGSKAILKKWINIGMDHNRNTDLCII